MKKRIAVWTALFAVQLIISGLAAVGVLALLCLWDGDLMFLVWEHPGMSIGLLGGLFSVVLGVWSWGVRWLTLVKVRKLLYELQDDFRDMDDLRNEVALLCTHPKS